MDPHEEAGSTSEHRAPTFELNPADWTTADEIRRRSFGTAEHGYDPQEVRDYLAKLANWFSDLNVQLSRLRKSQQAYVPPFGPAVPAPMAEAVQVQAPPEVGGLASRMADVLREAEEHASRVRADAELRAEQLLAKSREESDRLRDESGPLIQRARAEAEDRLRRTTEARDALLVEIRSLRDRLGELTGRLEHIPIMDEPSGPSEPPPVQDRGSQPSGRPAPPPVVLPDVVPERPSPDPVAAVEGAFVPQPYGAPSSPAGRADLDVTIRPDPEDLTAGAISNVRQFPAPEARADRRPPGDDLPPA